MGRPPRIHAPGATYHVTLRGNHRQDIFFEPADRHRLSGLFAEVLGEFNARLHAYCYMTNHVHALIQVGDAPLGNLIMRVAGQYARLTQWRLQPTGHLFAKRYYPVLADVDHYLLPLLRYIHLNPVRAGLAATPQAYPWSSHHAYAGSRIEPWVTTDFALARFGCDRARAIDAYRRFVEQPSNDAAALSPLLECNPNDRRILGGDDFARGLLGSGWIPRSRKSLAALIQEACEHFNCRPPDLESASRKPQLVAARAWVAHQAVTGRVASIAEVARKFNRDESSLRHALKTLELSSEVFPVSRPGTR
jgi:REP element-mobilizing transposase RayT